MTVRNGDSDVIPIHDGGAVCRTLPQQPKDSDVEDSNAPLFMAHAHGVLSDDDENATISPAATQVNDRSWETDHPARKRMRFARHVGDHPTTRCEHDDTNLTAP